MRARPLLGAVLLLLLAVAGPARAGRRTVTYWLDAVPPCGTLTFVLSRFSSPSADCALEPRVAYRGTGLPIPDPPFTLDASEIPAGARFDASRPLTGTFYVATPGPNPSMPDLAGPVGVDYVVAAGKVTIGTVHVEGTATPLAPVRAAFSLRLPRTLDGKRVTALSVTPMWSTCLTPCTTGTSVTRHSVLVLPLR